MLSLFNLFNNRDKKLRQSVIKNLLSVAMADGAVDRRELQQINDKAHEYGLTPAELRQIFSKPRSIELVVPDSYEERVKHLTELVEIMTINGDLDPAELRVCKRLAERFGFLGEVVDYMLTNRLDYDAALLKFEAFLQGERRGSPMIS